MSDVFAAIDAGDVERLGELVAAEPSLGSARNEQGISAVLWARYRDRPDLVDVLLSAAPQLDVVEAAAVGDADRLRELVEADSSLLESRSPDGFTPLHMASYFGHPAIVRYLQERGADVGAVSGNAMKVQPLHAACATGQLEIAEALLDAGANVNARQQDAYTPLHAAAANGDERLARLLLDYGADRGLQLDDGRTAADLASEEGHGRLLGLLAA